ncbi:transcription factor bHLH147 [Sorghum bicolor]|uniref:transcription factor bHLH147 n=1 Tax=Sorghum bicolor TaxID=4558 RepID=UPI00081ABFE6|nr:transcription factor bHLH147 [Sorghum bicolor]|eukprot:XP_021315782.1 transcription factor bHLH147 [Sorghum bicolor]
MASTSSSTTPAVELEAVEERGRKRKRAAGAAEPAAPSQPSKWRTRREHEIYSSKLLEAIRLVRAGPSSAAAGSAASAPTRSRAVREAADRALAVAARGRTHWSRAILASRRRRRLQAAHRARLRAPASPPPTRHDAAAAASASAAKGTATPPLARKAKVLGRLVPGCRKLSFPTLLAETTDYIAALQMQVRAMTALAEALSAVSATTSSSSSSGAGSSSPP